MAVADRRLGQIFFANSLVDSYSPPNDLIAVTKRIMAIVEVHLTDEAPPFEPSDHSSQPNMVLLAVEWEQQWQYGPS